MGIITSFNHLPWICEATFIVMFLLLIVVIGLLLVRKFFFKTALKDHHDVTVFIFSNLGVLYSVLLGFTIVNVQARFDHIKTITETEGSRLVELYRDAEVFSSKDKDAIRTALRNYADEILHVEWPAMSRRENIPNTVPSFKAIWQAYYNIEPIKEKQIAWYNLSIGKLNDLMDARLSRLVGTKESLGLEMWTLLLLGGALMIASIWFFWMDKLGFHIMLACILAASITFFLYLIYSLDLAFSGNICVSPSAIESAIQSFNNL